MSDKTHVCVLASTSSGNCTVIWNDRVSFLVDCGTSASYTEVELSALGLSFRGLSAVFITHCHGDHVNRGAINRLVEYGIPVHCHADVAKVLKKTFPALMEKKNAVIAYTKGNGVCKGFSFTPFGVPHDSKGGCFGYSFFLEHAEGTHKISIATDIGCTEPDHVARFADSDIIVIESNHDVKMLTASRRPQWLKDRIVKIGHLSNDQCGAFMQKVIAVSKNMPAAIVLAHISQECNTNDLAKVSMHESLAVMQQSSVAIVETYREKPSIVVSLREKGVTHPGIVRTRIPGT
jgi:phosphoribosyl 1,2-cyclic phosphodiesterase